MTLPAGFSAGAAAQAAWPNRPIRWVVPYVAGGLSDSLARLVGQELSQRVGQPVIIDNKAGAAGNIGTDFVAKSAPDGHTIVLGNIGPISVSQSLYPTLPYDPERDLAPISMLVAYPNVLLVRPDFPARTVREFIAHAKAQDKPLTYGTPGVGTSVHLAGELFARTAGIRMLHIPYKGGGTARIDAMSGRVDATIEAAGSGSMELVQGGKLRALAITSAERSALLPGVPTIAESGGPFANFDVTGWIGVLAAAATPPAILSRLVAETTAVLQMAGVAKKIAEWGAIPPMGPEHFAKVIRSESRRWRDVVQSAGIKLE